MTLIAVVVSLGFTPSLWELAQTNRRYALINWWIGFVTTLIDASFYAAAWGLVLYSAFGPGSGSAPRFLVGREKPQLNPISQPKS